MEKKYKERVKWSDLHEAIFVELWEENAEEFRGARKNTHIYSEMASDMQRHGLLINAAEAKAKINNLTIKYRKEKGTTGCSPSVWPLFERVHSILGQSKAINFVALTSDSIPDYELDVEVIDANFTKPNSAAVSPAVSPTLTVPPEIDFQEAGPSCSAATCSSTSSPRDAAKLKKFNFNELLVRFDKSQQKIDENMEAMRENDRELIALEREKVMLLRQQVEDAAEVKNEY